ncbi:hypothetical protein BC937DRAFT_94727 [Endogone sp. FLAS-F59071]|nr:hypothetical protein BC937DRAFT_94727 [Endogone sp. FLAS-F59071]|eukprot:RUS13814.1 hypothetical protein BC937DRAFT_94727 [Endogone sp. FLAS-F59071]
MLLCGIQSVLADRVVIDFRHPDGVRRLHEHFTYLTTVLHEEGLVIKRADSTYNPSKGGWVKLKRDYIHGLGDTEDFVVVGARYRPPEPGDLLRDQVAHVHNPVPCVVPAGTLNQFYIGCLENKKDVIQWDALPKFRILFTVQHGLPAKALLVLNAKLMGHTVPFSIDKNPTLPYAHAYRVPSSLCSQKPDVLLKEPFVMELLGAGFTRASTYSKHYVLRFPRCKRIYEERCWRTEGVGYEELQRMAMGVDDEESEGEEERGTKSNGGEGVVMIVEEENGKELRKRKNVEVVDLTTSNTLSSSLSTCGTIPLKVEGRKRRKVEEESDAVKIIGNNTQFLLLSACESNSFAPIIHAQTNADKKGAVAIPSLSSLVISSSFHVTIPSAATTPAGDDEVAILLPLSLAVPLPLNSHIGPSSAFPPACVFHLLPLRHVTKTRQAMQHAGIPESSILNTVDAVVEWVLSEAESEGTERTGIIVVERRNEKSWRQVAAYMERMCKGAIGSGRVRLMDWKVFGAVVAVGDRKYFKKVVRAYEVGKV